MEERIAQASRAFEALRKPVFWDQACVISMLLYGCECWTPLKKHYRKLNSLHHRCIRIILGITNRQQWTQRISMSEIRREWGDLEIAEGKVAKRRLEWLGHVALMPDKIISQVCTVWLVASASPKMWS